MESPRCSNSGKTSSGNNNNIGKSSKKQRPKKVPQRGLGVAQLEKIRLEEQQKNDSVCLIAAERPPLSVACNGNTSTVPLTSVDGRKFWGSCEFNLGKECFRTDLGLPCEIEPVWSLPGLMPFPQHLQQQEQPSSSMVNLPSRTSSTSVMNFQMEPPSNQSYYYKNFKPFLPEEEKVIGMKRPYPFSLDNSPGPSFHTKHYPPIVHSNNGQFEATSSTSNATITFDFESGTSNFREGPSCSTSNGVFARGFLTLAPPTTTSMCSASKSKLPQSNALAYQQASFEDSLMKQGSGGGGLNLQRPYYSFFPPPAMAEIERASAVTMTNRKREEVGGHVDLNLKL
ncbi:TCP Interactor containing EAR motif protein 3 [Hibiscus trionum]|uniref:TCP Interactor containing EAR motif protein 3 n=1 Tax=Hibiscus trionum TaxID=183268 RepID=A0A9W7MM72_HIBTR|nr:TCP Interactor containing EAR motif protein 3 [Hibiscus trionum]